MSTHPSPPLTALPTPLSCMYIYIGILGGGVAAVGRGGGPYRLGLRGAGGHHLAGWRAVVMLIVAALLVGWRWPQPDGLGGA